MADALKQIDKPLFPDILWERPQNKKTAKNLLIIGGHKNKFSQTQTAYQAAISSGIGEAKVLLPDSLQRIVGNNPDCLFSASNTSGAFSKDAYDDIITMINGCDGVLIVGEFSNNTETLGLFKKILSETDKPTAITAKIIEIYHYEPNIIIPNKRRLLIAPLNHLLKVGSDQSKTSDIFAAVEALKDLERNFPAHYVGLAENKIVIRSQNQTSLTEARTKVNESSISALCTTFWLQHLSKPFEALTAAAFQLCK